jgi:hypothetical protein
MWVELLSRLTLAILGVAAEASLDALRFTLKFAFLLTRHRGEDKESPVADVSYVDRLVVAGLAGREQHQVGDSHAQHIFGNGDLANEVAENFNHFLNTQSLAMQLGQELAALILRLIALARDTFEHRQHGIFLRFFRHVHLLRRRVLSDVVRVHVLAFSEVAGGVERGQPKILDEPVDGHEGESGEDKKGGEDEEVVLGHRRLQGAEGGGRAGSHGETASGTQGNE